MAGDDAGIADQPKNHSRIIAHVAAIGTSKASASPFSANVSRSFRRRRRFMLGTSMSGQSSQEDDTRTVITVVLVSGPERVRLRAEEECQRMRQPSTSRWSLLYTSRTFTGVDAGTYGSLLRRARNSRYWEAGTVDESV